VHRPPPQERDLAPRKVSSQGLFGLTAHQIELNKWKRAHGSPGSLVCHHRFGAIQSAALWWFAVLSAEGHNAMVCTRTQTWREYVPAETSGDPALGEHLPRGT
jgi:hypothetical protein